MKNTITFGAYNTWTDWGLISTSTPVVQPPMIKTEYVDLLSASDGSVDFTQRGTGGVVDVLLYRRTGSWFFKFCHESKTWAQVYQELLSILNGSIKARIVMSYDPDYYYYGTMSVNQSLSDEDSSTIVLNYDLDPYKRTNAILNYTGIRDWQLQDLFNGPIFYGSFSVDQNGKWRTFINPSTSAVVASVNCTGPCQMTIDGNVTNFPSGSSSYTLLPGDTEAYFLSASPITVRFNYSVEGKSL